MLTIFLDQETTGLDPTKHHVIEIALKVFDVNSGTLKAEYESIVKQPYEVWEARDPGGIEVNGFTWELIQSGKEPIFVGQEIIQLFAKLDIKRGKAVFICQNPGFDRGFFAQLVDVYTHEKLNWPYHWLDLASMYWTTRLQECRNSHVSFPKEILISKDEICSFHNIPREARPHRAMKGVESLVACYNAVNKIENI
jgi:DNA polymerase-3 subunit epsilon/oligoribonuclease